MWRETLGAQVTPFSGADGNGNGLVDEADYEVWRSQFGQTLPPPMAARVATNLGGPSAAPEELSYRPEPRSLLNVRPAFRPTVSDASIRSLRVETPQTAVATSASEARQDAALLAWLSQVSNRGTAEHDAANINIDAQVEPRVSYLASSDQVFTEIGVNSARPTHDFQAGRGPLR
jgi:hypothetical protein